MSSQLLTSLRQTSDSSTTLVQGWDHLSVGPGTAGVSGWAPARANTLGTVMLGQMGVGKVLLEQRGRSTVSAEAKGMGTCAARAT